MNIVLPFCTKVSSLLRADYIVQRGLHQSEATTSLTSIYRLGYHEMAPCNGMIHLGLSKSICELSQINIALTRIHLLCIVNHRCVKMSLKVFTKCSGEFTPQFSDIVFSSV